MLTDLRFALRSLRRHPAVTAVAVVSLALAIAGNTVVFSLVSGLLLRPFDYRHAEELVFLWQTNPQENLGQTPVAPANFLDLRERAESFSGMVAFRSAARTLIGDGEAEVITVGRVTPDFFPLLGKDLAAGRQFAAGEDQPGSHRVALLTHGFWQRRFGGDESLLQESLDLSGERFQVVGILPEGFDFVFQGVDLWIPYVFAPEPSRDERTLTVIARLRPGVSPAAADAEAEQLMADLAEEYPAANGGYGGQAITLRDQLPGESNEWLLWLMQGSLLFVLLIAAVNVANLLLARARRRGRELALRGALGASRGHLLRQLLAEGGVLALLGSLLGSFLAALGIVGLGRVLAGQMPLNFMPRLEVPVFLFTFLVTVLAAVIFALFPAWRSSRAEVGELLRGSGGASGRRSHRLVSRALVVVQVGLALILLSGAAMLIQSFVGLQRTDPGFDPRGVLTFRLTPPEEGYADEEARLALYRELTATLGALPGVEGAAVASRLPRSFFQAQAPIEVVGREGADTIPLTALWLSVSADYFGTLGVPVTEGRIFGPEDDGRAPPVVVVDRVLAQRLWPEASPLGEQIRILGEERRVIGIADTVRQELTIDPRRPANRVVYLPQRQHPVATSYVLLRHREGMAPALSEEVRRSVAERDPRLTVARLRTLEEHAATALGGVGVVSALLVGFGGLALFLAAIGVYGVIAYSVASRTREIGIRMALGARRGRIVSRLLGEGALLAILGFLLAIPGVLGVEQVVGAVVSGLAQVNPANAWWVAGILLLVALLASLLPARRAATVDPSSALRVE